MQLLVSKWRFPFNNSSSSLYPSSVTSTSCMCLITLWTLVVLILVSETEELPVISTDVLAELRHCSAKSSKAVNDCRDQYDADVNQYGRRGPPCCAYSKFVYCLEDALVRPCDKYVSRLLELFVNEKPAGCEEISYPSISCMITVNTNIIFGTAILALALSAACAVYYSCKCLCKTCSACRSK